MKPNDLGPLWDGLVAGPDGIVGTADDLMDAATRAMLEPYRLARMAR